MKNNISNSIGSLIFLFMIGLLNNPLLAQTSENKTQDTPQKEVKGNAATLPQDQFVNNQKTTRVIKTIVLDPKPIIPTYITRTTSAGESEMIQVEVPETEPKKVISVWQRKIKNKTKEKVKVVNGEIRIANTNLPEVSQSPIGIISIISASELGTTIQATVQIDSVTTITKASHSEMSNALKKYLNDFAIERYQNTVDDQIKVEEKKLKSFNGDLKKLQNQNERLHKKIKVNEATIKETDIDIKTNLKEQEYASEALAQAKKTYAGTSSKYKDLKDQAKKSLKEKEKDLKKLRSKNKNYHKKVVSLKGEIEKAKSDIELNLDQQSVVEKQIKKQAAYLNAVKEKRQKIK